MGTGLKVTSGPAIERAGDLAAILTNLHQGDILFIDEVHRLGRAVEEVLYPAMEDFALDIVIGKGPSARNIRLKLPRFTLIGATTRLALMTAPLRARFGAVYRFDFYEPAAMEQIVARAASLLNVPITPDGVREVARRGRGTPRVALRLLRRVRDYAQVRLTAPSPPRLPAKRWLCWKSTTWAWTPSTARCWRAIIANFNGGPVGPGDHRRVHFRRIRHDHGRRGALPAAAGLPGAHAARPRGHAAGLTSTWASPIPKPDQPALFNKNSVRGSENQRLRLSLAP